MGEGVTELAEAHRVQDGICVRVQFRIVADFYAGSPLVLQIAHDGCSPHLVTLGPDLAAGQRPQAIVPADAWQSAETTGDWTLVGCTVAPGFEFAGFEMAAADFEPAS